MEPLCTRSGVQPLCFSSRSQLLSSGASAAALFREGPAGELRFSRGCAFQQQQRHCISFFLRSRKGGAGGTPERPSVLHKFCAARVAASGIRDQDLAKHFVYHRALQKSNTPPEQSASRSRGSDRSTSRRDSAACGNNSSESTGSTRKTRSSGNDVSGGGCGSVGNGESCQSISNDYGEDKSRALKGRHELHAALRCRAATASALAAAAPSHWFFKDADHLNSRRRQALAAARKYAEGRGLQQAAALRRHRLLTAAVVSAAVLFSVSGLVYTVRTWYEEPLFKIPREDE